MNSFKIGYGKRIITPKIGTVLAGYDAYRKANDIHDDLFLRVLTFRGEYNFLLVQLDFVGVDYYFVDLVKENVKDLGFDDDKVFIVASHTHSGPTGMINTNKGYQKGLKQIFGEYDENYVLTVIQRIKETVQIALKDEKEGVLKLSRDNISGICSNRNNKEWLYDNELITIEIDRDDNSKILLYNLPCHPTVMNHLNLSITADFPNVVEKNLNEYDFVMFLNGSCGDISTRFTRQESSFKDMERIGILITEHIRRISGNVDGEKINKITCNYIEKPLQVKELDSLKIAKEKVEIAKRDLERAKKDGLDSKTIRVFESKVEGANNNYSLIAGFGDTKEIVAKVSILQINDYKLVFIPGEIFSSLGIAIKDKDRVNNIVCGYGNGYIGYIPDKFAYEKKTYETFSTPFKEGEGEELVKEILDSICI